MPTLVRSALGPCLVMGTLLSTPTAVTAQGSDEAERAYYDAVADYFDVPSEEVAILGEWNLRAEEVPVVLFMARRAGVPADVVVAQRRQGASWGELAGRYRVGAGAFYVPFSDGSGDALARAYGEFNRRPRGEWAAIQLEDPEIVSLVNIKILSQDLALAPGRVLEAREVAGDYPSGYRVLTRGRR